jgi:hypothetical protein
MVEALLEAAEAEEPAVVAVGYFWMGSLALTEIKPQKHNPGLDVPSTHDDPCRRVPYPLTLSFVPLSNFFNKSP